MKEMFRREPFVPEPTDRGSDEACPSLKKSLDAPLPGFDVGVDPRLLPLENDPPPFWRIVDLKTGDGRGIAAAQQALGEDQTTDLPRLLDGKREARRSDAGSTPASAMKLSIPKDVGSGSPRSR